MSTQGIRRNKLHKEGAILFQAAFDHRHAAVRSADSDYPLPKDQDVLIGDLLFSHKHSAINSRHTKARIGGLVIAVSPFCQSVPLKGKCQKGFGMLASR